MLVFSEDMLVQAVVTAVFLLFQFVAWLTTTWWYRSLARIMSIWVHLLGFVAGMYSLVQEGGKCFGDHEVFKFMVYIHGYVATRNR